MLIPPKQLDFKFGSHVLTVSGNMNAKYDVWLSQKMHLNYYSVKINSKMICTLMSTF